MERQRWSSTEVCRHHAVKVASSRRSIGSVAKELGLRGSATGRRVPRTKLRRSPAAPGGRTLTHGARHYQNVYRDLCRITEDAHLSAFDDA